MPRRCCRFCQQFFEPSKFRPDQGICSHPDCQRRRRNDYHRRKIETDAEYAEGVRDSRRKWRESHPDYQKTYRQLHEGAVARNRQLQGRRDAQRRVRLLLRNTQAQLCNDSPGSVFAGGWHNRITERLGLSQKSGLGARLGMSFIVVEDGLIVRLPHQEHVENDACQLVRRGGNSLRCTQFCSHPTEVVSQRRSAPEQRVRGHAERERRPVFHATRFGAKNSAAADIVVRA